MPVILAEYAAQNVSFWIIAVVMAAAAIGVVTMKNIVHAALALVVVLAGAAAQYVLLQAEFLGIVQVLIYIGAVIVLFLFGIMLTRAPIGRTERLDNDQRFLALTVSLFVLTMLGSILWDAFGDTKLEGTSLQTSGDVGLSIFRDYVIPFEVISVLLLAALVGAVVIARRD
ncbi:MAG TPA: NADH-quinone oxidoreductase subunit J [Actinomycetes bacterium]|nr:NADH-quinone oxidoreductase subunit J [Actinomycetes bacterium]